MKIKITHTSPEVIKEIDPRGGCTGNATLFFSNNDYAMGEVKAIYDIVLNEDEIVNDYNLHDIEIIEQRVKNEQV